MFHILYLLFCINVDTVECFMSFCLILYKCLLCILIVRLCILIVMYSYCYVMYYY